MYRAQNAPPHPECVSHLPCPVPFPAKVPCSERVKELNETFLQITDNFSFMDFTVVRGGGWQLFGLSKLSIGSGFESGNPLKDTLQPFGFRPSLICLLHPNFLAY